MKLHNKMKHNKILNMASLLGMGAFCSLSAFASTDPNNPTVLNSSFNLGSTTSYGDSTSSETDYYQINSSGTTITLTGQPANITFENNVSLTGDADLKIIRKTNNGNRHIYMNAGYVNLSGTTTFSAASSTYDTYTAVRFGVNASDSYVVDQTYNTLSLAYIVTLYTTMDKRSVFNINTLNLAASTSISMFTSVATTNYSDTGYINNLALFNGAKTVSLVSTASINLNANIKTPTASNYTDGVNLDTYTYSYSYEDALVNGETPSASDYYLDNVSYESALATYNEAVATYETELATYNAAVESGETDLTAPELTATAPDANSYTVTRTQTYSEALATYANAQTWVLENQTLTGSGTITVSSNTLFESGAYGVASNMVLGDGAVISQAIGNSLTISGDVVVAGDATVSLVVASAESYSSLDLSSFLFVDGGTLTISLDITDLESGDFSLAINDLLLGVFDLTNVDEELETLISLELTGATDGYNDYGVTASLDLSTSTIIFSSSAVPEPSTYAMIFGVVALGFAYYRRRK